MTENAFLEFENINYTYTGQDINNIIIELQREYRISNSLFSFAFGRDREKLPTDIAREMAKFKGDIDLGMRVVGAYDLGGHWIAYVMFKENDEIKCLYKDSIGGGKKASIEEDFIKAFYPSLRGKLLEYEKYIKPVSANAEQTKGVSCGVYAIKNMVIFAFENNLSFKKPGNISFYAPANDNIMYEERKDLGIKYAVSRFKEFLYTEVRMLLCERHEGEAEFIKSVIRREDVKVSIVTDKDDCSTYYYAFKCNNGILNYEYISKFISNLIAKAKIHNDGAIFYVNPISIDKEEEYAIQDLGTDANCLKAIKEQNSKITINIELNRIFTKCCAELGILESSKHKEMLYKVLKVYNFNLPVNIILGQELSIINVGKEEISKSKSIKSETEKAVVEKAELVKEVKVNKVQLGNASIVKDVKFRGVKLTKEQNDALLKFSNYYPDLKKVEIAKIANEYSRVLINRLSSSISIAADEKVEEMKKQRDFIFEFKEAFEDAPIVGNIAELLGDM